MAGFRGVRSLDTKIGIIFFSFFMIDYEQVKKLFLNNKSTA